jgi:hypothetical protein
MSQTQYLKLIEREIQRINKVIDFKIIHGEDYSKEARDHKLLLQKIRRNSRKSLISKFLPFLFQF